MNRLRETFAAFCLAVAPLPVLPGASDPFELPKRLVWAALAVVLALPRGGSLDRTPRIALAAGWGLAAWMLLRTAAAAHGPGAALSVPLAAWTAPLLLFLLAFRLPWSASGKRRMLFAVVGVALAEATLMLGQRFGFDPLFGPATQAIGYPPGRMVGTVGYQNQAAELLGIAFVCAVSGLRGRLVRTTVCALLAGTMVLAANRGALLALAAAGAVVAAPDVFRSRRAAVRAAAVSAVVAGFVLCVPEARSRLGELARPERSAAVASRLWMARAAVSLWKDHPAFGAGAGAYAREYVDRLGSVLPERKEHEQLSVLVYARETHCDPLQFAAEFGLAGIALLAVFLAAAACAVRERPDRDCDGRAAAALFAFVGVCSLFSFTWQTSLAGPASGFLLGALTSRAAPQGQKRSGAGRRIAGAAARLFLPLVVAAIVASETARSLRLPGIARSGAGLAENATGLLSAGLANEAAVLFEAAERDAVSPAILRNHASALAAAGRWKDSLAVCERWARCGIDHGDALRNVSLCHEKLGDAGRAAAAEAERLRLFPKSCSADDRFRLAVLFLAARDPESARGVADRFRLLCKQRDSAAWTPRWDNLYGGTLLALGKRDEARLHFEEALRRDPSLVSARRNLESLGESR